MKLHGNVEILSLYMDEQLEKKLQSSLESHLSECAECRETLARMQETKRLLSGMAPVPAPAGLEKEIIAGLPQRKNLSLPLKRIYMPAIGTLAILIVTSLLIYENLNREQTFQVARTPAPEERVTDNGFNKSVEGKKKPGHPDMSAVKKDREPASPGTAKPAVPEEKLMILSDKPQSETGGAGDDALAKKERAEEETPVGRELAAVAPASVMKSSADEAIGLAYRKPALNAIVIRSKEEWEKVWYTQNTAQNMSLPLPEVDFREKMVVALPSRIADKEYVVVNTIEAKDKIVVEYKELPLQKLAPPPYQLNVVNQKPAVELREVD